MLVLTRKSDQSIVIGDDIEIVVVEIRGDSVKLGINAPRRIAVHRKEVYEAIQLENIAASAAKPEDLEKLSKLFSQGPRQVKGDDEKNK